MGRIVAPGIMVEALSKLQATPYGKVADALNELARAAIEEAAAYEGISATGGRGRSEFKAAWAIHAIKSAKLRDAARAFAQAQAGA